MARDHKSSPARRGERSSKFPTGKTEFIDARAFVVAFVCLFSIPVYLVTNSVAYAVVPFLAFLALGFVFNAFYDRYIHPG